MLTLCADSSAYLFDKSQITNETNLLDLSSILARKGQTYLDKLRHELTEFAAADNNDLKCLFGAEKSIDELVLDYLKLFVFIYKPLKVPIRFNFLNANELSNNESLRISVEAFLPSEQKFLTVCKQNFDYLLNCLKYY